MGRGEPSPGDRERYGVRDDDVTDPAARAVGGQYRRCWARLRKTFWHVLHFWNPLHVSWCRLMYLVTIDLRHFEHLAFAGDFESIVGSVSALSFLCVCFECAKNSRIPGRMESFRKTSKKATRRGE